MSNTLAIRGGNTGTWTFTLTDADGDAVDLTDAEDLIFLVKSSVSDADEDAAAVGDATVTDAAAGQITVVLDPSDTATLSGMYRWGLQYTLNGNIFELPRADMADGFLNVRDQVVQAT